MKKTPSNIIGLALAVLVVGGFYVFAFINFGNPNFRVSARTPRPAASQTKEARSAPQAEPQKIEVTSLIVKAVGRKHRYFFDVRNSDSIPFDGAVRIDLIVSGRKLGGETFKTTQPIQPSMGKTVYIDANTGPPSVHGESGITSYRYEASVNGAVVATGTGMISSKFENLN